MTVLEEQLGEHVTYLNNPTTIMGRKFDEGKPRWGLLPWKPVEEIVKVLTLGSLKYEDHNWQRVPNASNRYFDAMHRHIAAWKLGEKKDPETGLSHLAHAGCCLLFLMWFENKEQKDDLSI